MEARRDDPSPPPLRLHLFGPFEVWLHDRPLPRLRSRKSLWLLALLALRKGAPVERDWLAGLLWPERMDRQALRNSLSELRRALGSEADRLHTPMAHTVALELIGAEVDVVTFDTAISRGEPNTLAQAVSLYRGPLLEGCVEEWAFQERQVREQAYLQALETLAALAGEEPAEAERHLRRAVAADPLRESAQRSLMEALAAGGNYAGALLTYRELRLRLHRELNAEPDPETQALFQRLRQEARQKASGGRPALAVGAGEGSHPNAERPILAPPSLRTSLADRSLSGTVTFLFTDIEGSSRLWETHPQAMRQALAEHDRLLQETIESHGGEVFKTFGDQFCAIFGTAPAALAAAITAQQRLQAERWEEIGPLRVRMALHTGTAQARDGDYFGPALNRIARLLEVGHGGQVLLSGATQELVRDELPAGADLRDIGEYRLKNLVRPEQIYQLAHPDLLSQFPPLPGASPSSHHLPVPPTPLLGREAAVAALREWLQQAEVRLVTLTGPGGTGKSRLGLEVATDLLDQFADGVFLVELASLGDPHLVEGAIARSLGVRETRGQPLIEELKGYLRGRQLLLVLDNFEHLLPAASLVAELLAAAPGLKALVTSRAPLQVRGEKEYPVPPLALPLPMRGFEALVSPTAGHDEALHPAFPVELAQSAAVQLFLQRARDVRPEFALTAANAPVVAEICCRLEGLPLAIELAAARIGVLTPQQMLSRLEQRFELLVGRQRAADARHRSLRAALDWSYQLLPPDLQRFFSHLSIFRGGWSLEAAEVVCEEPRALEYLEELQQCSLVVTEVAGETMRYRLLETMREYGAEQLSDEERGALACRRAQYFLALAEQWEPKLEGPNQQEILDELEREHDNLRAVLAWSRMAGGDTGLGLRLAGAIWWFWDLRRDWHEGWEHLLALLDLTASEPPSAERAKALWAAGNLALYINESPRAASLFEESLMASRELGDRRMEARALHGLADVASSERDLQRAVQIDEQALPLARTVGDKMGITWCLMNLTSAALRQGNLQRATTLASECLSLAREMGNKWCTAAAAMHLGDVMGRRGDYEQAVALLEQSLALFQSLGVSEHALWVLQGLGGLARAQGAYLRANTHLQRALRMRLAMDGPLSIAADLEQLAGVAIVQRWFARAARLFSAAAALRDRTGSPVADEDIEFLEADLAVGRTSSDAAVWGAAWAEGQTMPLEQAIAEALQEGTAS